jgi:hypothetical protein
MLQLRKQEKVNDGLKLLKLAFDQSRLVKAASSGKGPTNNGINPT